jgi:hypothetical protein
MKNLLVSLLFLVFISTSCKKEVNCYDSILNKRDSIINSLGRYDFSPSGKDSVFVKSTYGVSYKKIYSLDDIRDKLDREWDSLIFLSKKYDTFPKSTYEQSMKRFDQDMIFMDAMSNAKVK